MNKKIVTILLLIIFFNLVFSSLARADPPTYNPILTPADRGQGVSVSPQQPTEKCGWLCTGFRAFIAQIIEILAIIIKYVFAFIHYLIAYFNLKIASPLANFALSIDPFISTNGGKSPAEGIWFILKTFSYIVLVFSALSAGFQWILGQDNQAKSLIFNIIIVALLIDFSFLLVKEAFYIVKAIENSIVGSAQIINPDGSIVTATGSSMLGTLIAAVSWQSSPLNDIAKINDEISKAARLEASNKTGVVIDNPEITAGKNYDKNKEALINSFAAIGMSIFYVSFAMIIFIMLFVLIGIGIARFIMLILLSAASSFAFVSLAFPKFKPPFDVLTSSVNNMFNSWLRNLASWILVVPVFTIMMILGIILRSSFFSGSVSFGFGAYTGLIQFILSLLIILAWFLISLRIAVNLSGNVGKFAQNFATKSLSWAGITLGGAFLGKLAMGGAARTLEGIGERLEKRAGLGWLGRRMYGASKVAKNVAKGLRERQYKRTAEDAEDMLKNAYARVERAKTDQQKKDALDQLTNLLRDITKDPNLASRVDTKKISNYALREMADDKQASKEILDIISKASVEDQQAIFSRIDKDTVKKLMGHMKDPSFADFIKNMPSLTQDLLTEKIKNLDPDDAFELLTDSNFRNNIKGFKNLENAFNKATKGLYDGIVNQAADKVANALSDLPSDFFRHFPQLDMLLEQSIPQEKEKVLGEALQRNASAITAGLQKLSAQEARNISKNKTLQHVFENDPGLLRSLSVDQLRPLLRFLEDNFLDQNLTPDQKASLGIISTPTPQPTSQPRRRPGRRRP
ncbi:MAG: hypothetical protein KatS3mg093_104 [Candidatus Parcubacteria bacterium]|nr:MAG: hypothetical protein KatS3mg093_104 [Candidatus Parcubacteria bacterium]